FTTGSTKNHTADMGRKGKDGSSQNNIDDKGYWDSGCSRHMTGNISYLSDSEPFDGGYVSFGQGGCKITGKGTIKTRQNFKLLDDANILLRNPRQHNMYSIDLNNIVSHKDLTCLVAKASADECILLHRRLGKFEAKGDEVYFIGYSMSSKAYIVFNKRTRKVEENLHVEFLENKAIEKGAGPNWLFDIDSLTKSMNYLPVDAGTNSTNLSVETSIPTVCLPVPTACFTDSPEPPSDARLILKRVANQVETPSLDNILTLANRFEDILEVITNSDESNGVEADVSNMETTITASPTPTLRIHRDHPKSQIIGPVDTPIQTRNKSKDVGEQSFIATIHQKTDPALLQFCLFSFISMYQMDVKSALLYGTIDEELSSNTPMDKENPWGKDKTGKDVDLHLYRSMIGSLMYLTASRPDIMFAVCACARHQVTPKEFHLHAAHDALLESSSSKSHDESSSQVPKCSGNPNPTVSSSNPPAGQMETLTVESSIPTVSSPVLTACLNDSPEPSNILGVTTSSDEAIGVEADVSNMETTISASPTPTLRIHKDHPKSEIISPVDTPIQTRHKSKIMKEQSFIATIHQKTDPALL
nr:ribonuclease H-like domain-containing protein [Tanacetum cinerariifolium]